MSNKFAAMSKDVMKAEGAKLMNLVQQTEISEEIQKLIKTECDKAFAKGDKCPVGIDIAFLFDVSGSMKPGNQRGWAWNTQEELIEGVVPQAMNYDEGGIDLWAIRTASELERIVDPEIECKLNVKDPHMALQYVRSFEKKLGDTPTRPLFNKLVGGHVKRAILDPVNTKLLDIKVSTDGLPNQDLHPTMTATTEQANIALHEAGLDPCRYLAISYVIITDDSILRYNM
ncbi:hypothetical protein F5883DRAFT_595753 [Diaporthe sp. PMI_573]|nr:hypothetical protein F5883DRAFT_595753 [Diaporthaceae sp. PMI_573]